MGPREYVYSLATTLYMNGNRFLDVLYGGVYIHKDVTSHENTFRFRNYF